MTAAQRPAGPPPHTAVAQAAAAAVARVPGIDDRSALAEAGHRRPVALVHGTFGNADSTWFTAAPLLATAGHRAFRLDYGVDPAVPGPGGRVAAPGQCPGGGPCQACQSGSSCASSPGAAPPSSRTRAPGPARSVR